MTLPDWIQWDKEKGDYVLLESSICPRCGLKWVHKIQHDRSMKPEICTKCKLEELSMLDQKKQ